MRSVGRLGTVLAWAVLARALVTFALRAHTAFFLPASMEDLEVYRAGGSALLHGQPLYSAHPPGSGLPFTYTPFAALVFTAFAPLPVTAARTVWTLLSLTALVRTCWLLARAVESRRDAAGQGWPRRAAAFPLLLAVGLVCEPTAETLAFGQVNLLILWLVVEDWFGLPGRTSRLRGALTGIAAGLKLVPAMFVALMPLVGRRRQAVVAAVTALTTVALGFLVQPDQAWSYWTDLAYDPSRVGGVSYAGNQSINGALSRLLGDTYPHVVWLVVAVPVAVLALAVGRLAYRRGEPLLGFATVAVGMLLVSPISWSHHWVWVVVVAAACLGLLWRWEALLALALVVLSTMPRIIWWAPSSKGREHDWSGWQLVTGNAYVLWGVVFLAIAAVVVARLPARAIATRSSADEASEPRPAAR